ncbi:MAG TPA: DUF881 domain-containing protein [Nocardioidaceae bacterium]|nr:DUF881 domain-containing protein [Nocardioidaceae bacterium]
MPEPQPEVQTAGPAAPDGRARLVAALRRPGSRGQVVAGLLLAALGFAAVTQVQANRKDDAYVGARQSELIQYIDSLSLASQRAENQIARLERTRDALGNDTEARRTALARARQQATTLGILAGTVPAEGPGVQVTVTDEGSGVGTNQLIDGLQELRDAGAEVIELNDKVRVVASTSLQDAAAGGVLVDGTALRAPYLIEAIGDAHTLGTALDFTGGFIDEVRAVGGKVTVRQRSTVQITTVVDPRAPSYARPSATG